MDRSWSARLNSLRVFWYRRIVNFDQQSQAETLNAVKNATDSSGKWVRAALAEAARRIKAWVKGPWDWGRILRLAAGLARGRGGVLDGSCGGAGALCRWRGAGGSTR